MPMLDPIDRSARRLANVLYESEATILHHLAPCEVTAEKLEEWLEGTIDMIQADDCDDFNLKDMQEALLCVHEITAVIRSWG